MVEVLPFLYGRANSLSGTRCPKKKLGTKAICCVLGVSRQFIYSRKSKSDSPLAGDNELTSILDTAGLRLRQHRRTGERLGYCPLEFLKDFECGCDQPCFSEVPLSRLESEFNAFSKLSQELRPRQKENRFLLNVMFCPLSNCTVR